jgi:hypothetical protein
MKIVFETENDAYDFTVEEHGADTIVINSLEDADPFYMFSIVLNKDEAMLLVEHITKLCK